MIQKKRVSIATPRIGDLMKWRVVIGDLVFLAVMEKEYILKQEVVREAPHQSVF